MCSSLYSARILTHVCRCMCPDYLCRCRTELATVVFRLNLTVPSRLAPVPSRLGRPYVPSLRAMLTCRFLPIFSTVSHVMQARSSVLPAATYVSASRFQGFPSSSQPALRPRVSVPVVVRFLRSSLSSFDAIFCCRLF